MSAELPSTTQTRSSNGYSRRACMLFLLMLMAAANSPAQTIYLGRVWEVEGRLRILIEDHVVRAGNERLWESDDFGTGYDRYVDSIRNTVRRYRSFTDTISSYYFSTDHPEFRSWTAIRTGDRFAISVPGGVLEGAVGGYAVILDEAIGAGVVFHPSIDAPGDVDEDQMVVCVKDGSPGPMVMPGQVDAEVRTTIAKTLLPKVRRITRQDWNSGKRVPIRAFLDDELTIVPGSYTEAGAIEFLVSLQIRRSFDRYASAVFVMSPTGRILATVSPFTGNEFTFTRAEAAVDTDGDGVMEVLVYSGYYEGGGYALKKRLNGKYKEIASGFYFGV